MAPWPRLMTPIRPKITARPEAASASTRVMRTASATTLRTEASKLSPGGGRGGPAWDRPIASEWQRLAGGRLGLHRRERLDLLEHVVHARPARLHAHQVGRQHRLVVVRP